MRNIFASNAKKLPEKAENYVEGTCYVPREELTQDDISEGLGAKEKFESSEANAFLNLITTICAEISNNGILEYHENRKYGKNSLCRFNNEIYFYDADEFNKLAPDVPGNKWVNAFQIATDTIKGYIDTRVLYAERDVFSGILAATPMYEGYINTKDVIIKERARDVVFRDIVNDETTQLNNRYYGIISHYSKKDSPIDILVECFNVSKLEGKFNINFGEGTISSTNEVFQINNNLFF